MSLKAMSLPINSTAILVLTVMFLALIFGLVSTVIEEEENQINELAEENTPDIEDTKFESLEDKNPVQVSGLEIGSWKYQPDSL